MCQGTYYLLLDVKLVYVPNILINDLSLYFWFNTVKFEMDVMAVYSDTQTMEKR